MASRRNGGFSPQKEVRRSCRERQAVYKSLDENELGIIKESALFQSLANSAEALRRNEICERDVHVAHRTSHHAYPTRASEREKVHYEDDFGTTEDEEDENTIKRSSRRVTRRGVSDYHDEDRENDEMTDGAHISKRDMKRRRVIVEDDDEEQTEEKRDGEDDVFGSMYERVKSRHQVSVTPDPNRDRSVSHPPERTRSLRLRQRERKEESKGEGDTNEEEDEEEEDQEPRQYQLRRNRNPVERYAVEQTKSEKRQPVRFSRVEEVIMRRAREKRRRNKGQGRRRLGGESDSTDTSDENDKGGSRHRDRDEDNFERRKARSMQARRNRFMPINLSERDLSSSQSVIRERLRQTGASCSDIDPMSLDNSVGFEKVGGLGHHIQSLKEVVLFPMLYPEIFGRFNINPPKGVVFYGPPGTGKTLVARALANECSKGAKKVAFFMRKGADCLSKWVGESERQLRLLFDQAYAMRPSIIFFDEIDGLAPVRSSRQDQIHSSIVSTLLALMDGLDSRGEVVVIGATNRLDTLDPALRRPGRFDRELKFNLPDASARLQILEIHTEKWEESRPDESTMQWLAESTSGYCGADLKLLCTEAVLIALRSKYPHIYMSKEKLSVDPSFVKIVRNDFVQAMRRITPASRRDLSIPSRPLDERTSILLKSEVEMLMQIRIPSGYRCSESVHNLRGDEHELEKVVRALEIPPIVPAVRLLICGTDRARDAGQTSYVLPALLGRLDHLPVFSLAVGRLFADGRPEEALSQTIQSALRAASSGPAILLLPSIDQWYSVVPPSVSHMLVTALDSMTGFTSIMFLATCDTHFMEADANVRELFRAANAVEVHPPNTSQRKEYFEFLIKKPALIKPKKFDASLYTCPPVATPSSQTARKLSENEAKELNKLYEGLLRQFRIFLRDMLARLMRDRRFHIFNNPVEEEDANDYYQIIENPMCMTDMMGKIDRKEYSHPAQFLSDIRLIMSNALEYNPDRNQEDKTIRHQAVALCDMAEALLDMELDEEFVERLEETARLLTEAGIDISKKECILPTPAEFSRTTRLALKSGYVEEQSRKEIEINHIGEDKKEDASLEHSQSLLLISTPNSTTRRRKRRMGSYSFGSAKQKRKAVQGILKKYKMQANSRARSSQSTESDTKGAERKKEISEKGESTDEDMEVFAQHESVKKSTKNGREDREKGAQEVLIFNEEQCNDLVEQAVFLTSNWPIPELERLAAVVAHTVDGYRDRWDRTELPSDLEKIFSEWKYES